MVCNFWKNKVWSKSSAYNVLKMILKSLPFTDLTFFGEILNSLAIYNFTFLKGSLLPGAEVLYSFVTILFSLPVEYYFHPNYGNIDHCNFRPKIQLGSFKWKSSFHLPLWGPLPQI